MKKILVVDDEQDLCNILQVNLEMEGYSVTTANSAEDALRCNPEQQDLMLLDVMMDDISGFELAKQLKQSPATTALPIIFITAKDNEDDLLQGFSLGADDYITKPFSLREVMARIKAVLARTSDDNSGTVQELVYEGLVLNINHRTATIDGEKLTLTKTEFELLHLLMRECGHVLSREQLITRAWPHKVVVTGRTVDVNITRLRKKLGPYARCIVSRHGFGYTFEK